MGKSDPIVEVHSHAFDKAIGELAKITGAEFSKIIKFEASKILGEALTNTRAGNVKKIEARYTYKDDGRPNAKLVTYAYLNGKRRIVRKIRKKGAMVMRGRGKNRKLQFDPNKTNPDWRVLQAELKRLKAWKKARRGMSKATWLYLAQRLKLGKIKGSHLKYVNKSLGLMTSNLKATLNAKEVDSEAFYGIELKNVGKVPMIKKGGKRDGAGGFEAFTNAFNGRIGFFYENLAHGVFDSVKKTTAKYKGFALTPVQNTKKSDPVR